jgi:hypothetical protein
MQHDALLTAWTVDDDRLRISAGQRMAGCP